MSDKDLNVTEDSPVLAAPPGVDGDHDQVHLMMPSEWDDTRKVVDVVTPVEIDKIPCFPEIKKEPPSNNKVTFFPIQEIRMFCDKRLVISG